MDTNMGPGVSASGTDPFHARQTAGRTPTSSLHVSKNVSDIQPPDTDQQLADTVNNSVKTSAADGRDVHYVEASASRFGRSSKTGIASSIVKSAETSVTEDNDQTGLPPDSGYGPSLWTGELGTPDGSAGRGLLQYYVRLLNRFFP